MQDEKKVAVITGASSGFGLLIAVALAKNNFIVVATMRDLLKMDNLVEEARKNGVQNSIHVFAWTLQKKRPLLQR